MKNLRKPEEIIINGVSLKELLKSHKKWLDNKENGKQLILKNANLKNANLKNADLRYVDLENANLEGADLKDANLENANLKNANLKNVNLRYANLKYTILENAILENANLEGANLTYTDLENADLEDVDLKYANLVYANLENISLKNTKFYLTNLYKVKRKDLFEVGSIGSRNDTTHYFIKDNRIIYGCFDGSLENFEEKVKDTYDKNSKEYMEYMIAIDTFKKYKEMYYKIKES